MFREAGLVFMGEFEVAMDDKNRVMIPSKGKTSMDKEIVLCDGFEGAIEIRTKAVFKEYYEKLIKNDYYSKHVRVLKRKILGTAREIVLDKGYRFVIPSTLNKDFKGSVIMRGNGDSIEIGNRDTYQEGSDDEENTIEKAAEAIARRTSSVEEDSM